MHQEKLEKPLVKALHRAFRYISTIVSLLLVNDAPPAAAADQDQTRPPAHLHCSLKVGESSLLEGPCRVTTLKGSRMLIEGQGKARITLLAVPENERDRIFWNEGNHGKSPKKLLGIGQWLDNCWRSVSDSSPTFYLCLIAKKAVNAAEHPVSQKDL